MYTIDKIFANHKCKTCGNLTYWDGYYCKFGKHQTKKEKLDMRPLKDCDGYIKRESKNHDYCKGQECVFWCMECPVYIENN